jgi:hypothetical protein
MTSRRGIVPFSSASFRAARASSRSRRSISSLAKRSRRGDRRWESRRPSLSCGGRRWSAPSRRLRGLRLRRTLFTLSKHSGVSRPSGTKQRKVIGSNRYLFLAAQVEAHWQTLAHERLSFVIVNYRRLRLLLFKDLRCLMRTRAVVISPILPGGPHS